MSTSSNVSILIDPADPPRVVVNPARTVTMRSGWDLPVGAYVALHWDTNAVHVNGTPAEVAAWFRQVAEQIDATAAAELAVDVPIPFTVTDAGREALGVVA